MQTPQALLVRADAGERMGTGHVMRCLALAQAWHDSGGNTTFLAAGHLTTLSARLNQAGKVERLDAEAGSDADALETCSRARRLGTSWIVLDGYHFSGGFQRRIKEDGLRLLALDDYGHAEHYWADLVLNQNLYARAETYRNREPHTELLLGTEFALLRHEFSKWRGWRRVVPECASKILVTLGGSDPDNVTLRVIQALALLAIEPLQVVVVVGASNPHLPALEKAVRQSKAAIELRANVTDMPELMAWADVCLSAAGSTIWELLFMGLPTCCTVIADNQVAVASVLTDRSLAVNFGHATTLEPAVMAQRLRTVIEDQALRRALSARGQAFVDGHGARRILEAMLSSQSR